MAFTTEQLKGLDVASQRKILGQATAEDTKNLAYATSKGYQFKPVAPAGKVAIPGVEYNTREKQQAGFSGIEPVGNTLYGIPNVSQLPNELSTDEMSGNSNVQPANVYTGNLDTLMAGVKPGNDGVRSQLDILNKDLRSQAEKDAIDKRMGDYGEEQKTAQRDLQEEKWAKYNLDKNFSEVEKIMPEIARIKAEYDNAEIAQEGRKGTASSIYGRQALIQRQRATELAGLSAVAQAYQGNVDQARNIAQDALNANYQDQQTYFTNLKIQLDSVKDDLTREEKVKFDSLNLVIAERERNIETEKLEKQGIYEIALKAAEMNVSSDIASQIVKAKTPEEAMIIALKNGVFKPEDKIEDRFTKIGQDGSGNDIFLDNFTGTVKTGDQLTTFQLGNQIGTIQGLPSYSTRSANPGVVRSDRNNNPGNIKVSSYTKEFEGVLGVESDTAGDGGNFLIFESPEAGINAIGRLLLEGKSYKGVTAEQAIKKYNGNGGYGALNVGLDPNKDFQSQIQDPNKRYEVAKKIAMAEGWSGGLTQTTGQTTTFSQTGIDWAESIRDNKVKLTDITSDVEKNNPGLKSEVIAIMKTLPPSDAQITDAQNFINDLVELRDSDAGLKSAVGPTAIARGFFGMRGAMSGERDAFLGKASTLISKKALDSLIEAKSQGATFGALSDTEMNILKSAATTLGAWGTSKNDKLQYFDVDEESFKEELDSLINNYKGLLAKAGTIQSLDSFLQSNPDKVNDYNTVIKNNPNLTEEEILQIINN